MSKALAVLKLFFSLVSFNTTSESPSTSYNHTNSTNPTGLPVPLLLQPISHIACFVGQAFKYKVPDDTFYPTHYSKRKDNLKLSMFTVNGGKISPKSWLQFDPRSRTVVAFPLAGNEGTFGYWIKATNAYGKSAKDILNIDVRSNGGRYNHEFVISTAFSLTSFISNVVERYDFIYKLARYSLRKDISTVWLKSYNKRLKQLTIAFNTIHYEPCDKDALQALLDKFVTRTGEIRSSFQKTLTMKYPIRNVELRPLGPCVPPPTTPKPPFEWGILKHLMPILMMMFVIGLPVGISCIVHKRSKRRRAILMDQLRKKRKEEEMSLTFHTVHYNNRYPSMLSVSNTSKEEDTTTGDEERSSNTKLHVAISNGNVPSSPVMNGPSNAINNQNKSINTNVDVNTNINTNANVNTNVNLDKNPTKPSRIVYMGKSDMNIPVYLTKPKEENQDESEMSFLAIANSISSTIKGLGKSVLNIAGQGEEGDAQAGEKVNNINVAGNVSAKNGVGNKPLLLSSELQLPLNSDAELKNSKSFSVRSIETETGTIGIPKRSRSELRLSDLAHHSNFKEDYEMFNEHSNITGTLMSPGNVRLPQRRFSMPQLDISHDYTERNNDPLYQIQNHGITPLKSCLKTSETSLTNSTVKQNEQLPRMSAEGMIIGDLTQQIQQMSREVREDFGNKGSPDVQYPSQQFQSREPDKSYVEDEDLAIGDEEALDYTTWRIRQIKKAQEREKQLNQNQSQLTEEYNIGMFTEHEQHEMAAGHEYYEMDTAHGHIQMDEYGHVDLAHHGHLEMGDYGHLGQVEMVDHGHLEMGDYGPIDNSSIDPEAGLYEDYTNPYQYANGGSITGRSQSTYFTNHSWSDDYEKENRYKQQQPSSSFYGHHTHSMPSLIDNNHTNYYYEPKVDNRSKAPANDKSVIGKLFSREQPVQNRNLNVKDQPVDDGSLVGYLKTRVGGIIGPPEGGSSWFK